MGKRIVARARHQTCDMEKVLSVTASGPNERAFKDMASIHEPAFLLAFAGEGVSLGRPLLMVRAGRFIALAPCFWIRKKAEAIRPAPDKQATPSSSGDGIEELRHAKAQRSCLIVENGGCGTHVVCCRRRLIDRS